MIQQANSPLVILHVINWLRHICGGFPHFFINTSRARENYGIHDDAMQNSYGLPRIAHELIFDGLTLNQLAQVVKYQHRCGLQGQQDVSPGHLYAPSGRLMALAKFE